MLLTIHNLPSNARYSDVKSLLQEKCGLTELILDNLTNEGKTKKVTVGLADEGDAAILVRKINGLYINGQQLYVEDKRKKKDSDQPYRSSASIMEEAQYQEAAINPQLMMEGAMMPNPMMMNMVYMPMPSMDQNIPYMAYGVPQAMPPADFHPPAPVPNERAFAGFQGEDKAQGRARDAPQGRDAFRNRDRNPHPSPDRPAEAFNRPSRWNEKPAPNDFPMRREMSPPRQTWVPPATNQGPRAPFRKPERPGPRDPKQYQPRQPEPEFRRTDTQWEDRPSGWDAEPDPHMRSEPEQEWASSRPNRNFDPMPNRPFEEPNQQWNDYPPNEEFARPDHFVQNEQRFSEDYPPNDYGNEPDFHGGEPEFQGNVPEFRGHEPEFHGHESDFRGPERPERGYNNDHERRPQQPDAAWNKGNDSRDRNFAPNNWSKDKNRGERRDDRRPHQQSRPEKPPPIPSSSTSQRGNERRDDVHPNPKRPHSDRDRTPDNWKQISNDYPASKKPKGNFDRRDNFQEPRPKPRIQENLNVRPQSFKQGVVTRPTHEGNPTPFPKQYTMKNLINKDQTSRCQATAIIAKEVMPPAAMADPEQRFILKELKMCIKGRIDVMLGEELSTHYEDVIKRYRLKYSKNKDRNLFKAIHYKCMHEDETQQKKKEEVNAKAVREETVVKTEPAVKEETVTNEESMDPGPSVSTQKDEHNNELNQNQITAPTSPLTDKQIIKEQKKQRKLEFTKADLFKLDPIMDQVLDEELNKLNDIFASECENPVNEVDSAICNRISNQSSAEFKQVLRVHLVKRILNVTTGLPIRIFSEGKLPKRTAIKEYLRPYRIERLVLKKNKKGTMYILNLSNYEEYDKLCQLQHDVVDGTPVTFRNMNLLGPPLKMSKTQIQKRRREFIENQLDSIEPGDGMEAEDYTGDVDIDDFNDEDLEDF